MEELLRGDGLKDKHLYLFSLYMDGKTVISNQKKVIDLQKKQIATKESEAAREKALRMSETERADKNSDRAEKEIKRKKRWRKIGITASAIAAAEGVAIVFLLKN